MARIKPLMSGPIEKIRQAVQKPHREIDPAHLAFVRTLPCAASLTREGVIAHHIRMGLNRGGRKPDDSLAVPLNSAMHQGYPQSLHSIGEAKFWNALGIDAFALASVLWKNSGDYARCLAEVEAARAAGAVRRRYWVKIYMEKTT